MIYKFVAYLFLSLSITVVGFDYSVTVTPNEGVIGDVFTYTLDLHYSESETLVSIPGVSLFEEFHIQGKSFDKTLENGLWSLLFSVEFQVLDVEAVIPTHSIKYKKRHIKTETISAIPIPINSMVLNDDEALNIDDIKQLPNVTLSRKSIAYILFFVLLVLGVIAVICMVWKRRKLKIPETLVEEEIDPRTAEEKYLLLIEDLLSKQYLQKEAFKEFYTELIEIVKHFLFDITKIDVVDMTTSETISQIEETIDLQTIRRLKNVLEFSDLVKFSKFDAKDSNHEDMLIKAKEVITRIQKNGI
jgi:hypothetical protein